ncbi:TonB-dependent receptor [Telluribacter humicola]
MHAQQLFAFNQSKDKGLVATQESNSLISLLSKLELKYKTNFVYEKTLVESKTFDVEIKENEQLESVLDKVLPTVNLQYKKLKGGGYVLLPAKPSTPKPTPLKNSEARNTVKDHTLPTNLRPTITTSKIEAKTIITSVERLLRGTVTDETGAGLPGVSIVIKGTTRGTTSDASGTYQIEIPDGSSTLIFSFVGYVSQEVEVGNQTRLDVILSSDTKALEEMVVIGYGTAKKSDLTGSVVRVNAETFQNQSVSQLTEMLSGRVAGFASNQGTSAAGGGSMEIRGPNSLSAGSSPMVVLDGVIYKGSLLDINPNDIETIDILKDASSAAVYGSRAASGVILVTTKKGKSGTPTINFTARVGVAEATRARRPYNAEEYIKFRQDFFRTVFPSIPYDFYTHPDQLPSGLSIDQWRGLSTNPQADNTREWMARMRFFDIEQKNYVENKTTDWYNEVMTKGLRQDYDVSIGGGTDKIRYYWSLGYLNNEGIILGDKFSAVRSRINVDYEISKWLNAGINAQFSDRDESSVPASLNFYSNSPYGQMFDDQGNLIRLPHGHTDNPLLDYYRKDRLKKTNNLFSNIYANVKLPLGINYKISFQPRYETMKDLSFTSTDIRLGGLPSDISQGSREEYSHYEWMIDHLITWNRDVGLHNFDVTLLYNVEETNRWSSIQTNKNFSPSQQLGYHGLQFGDGPAVSNDDYRSTGDALMARLNYTFADRYLLTASIRRDGYSAFGEQNKRATFPALAFAWRISEEEFFNFEPINQLKLRASWGVNGNRDIGIYSSLARINSNLWFDGTRPRIGVFNSSLANTSLRWERTQSVNFGLDMSLFANRIDLTLDYYDMTTRDLLMNRNLPSITGFANITSNLGELGNKGFEMTINTVNINERNFKWRTNLVFSFNRNKIKKLFGDVGEYRLLGETRTGEIPDFTNQWFPGQPIDVIWDYELLGVWQVDEAAKAAEYGMRPGDFKGVDVDQDGIYNELVDKQFIGYTSPRYRFGLSNDFTFLKNFTSSVFLRADLGHMGSYSNALLGGYESNDRTNRNVGPVPYWTPENPINDYARLDLNTSGYGGGLRIFKPRSFVRVQDVTLAYNVPSALAQKMRLSNVRVFGALRNIMTFTKWPHWDPESGSTPMPKSYTLGLNVTL